MRRAIVGLLLALTIVLVSAPIASAQTPPTPKAPLLKPLDYLKLLDYGWRVVKGLKACGTPAGCFSSGEMNKLYAMDAKLDQLVKGMAQLQTSVDELTRLTTEGFLQLNIDLKQTRYAIAEANLTELTSDTEEAFTQLQRATNPDLSPKERTDAYRDFMAYASRLDGKTFQILQKVGGDPASPQSQVGVLPAAWDVLLAYEAQRQKLPLGNTPPIIAWQTQYQMRQVGDLWISREVKLAQVLSAYKALTADTEADAQRRSDEAVSRFLTGTPSHPSLPNQTASLPRLLPSGTGLLTGDVSGSQTRPGLIIGNFGAWRELDDERPIYVGDTGWGISNVSFYAGRDPSTAVAKYTDVENIRYSASRQALIWRYTGNPQFTRPGGEYCLAPKSTPAKANDLTTWDALCNGSAAQRWIVRGATLRPSANQTLCLAAARPYPAGWQNQQYVELRLQSCTNAYEQLWFLAGPTPIWFSDLQPEVLQAARTAGSPQGDNPDGTGPWRTDWAFLTTAQAAAIGQSFQASGADEETLARAFSLPSVSPESRLLPPYLRIGYGFDGPRRFVFRSPFGDCGGVGSTHTGIYGFDGAGNVTGNAVCRSDWGTSAATFVRAVDPCDYVYVKDRVAASARAGAVPDASCRGRLDVTIVRDVDTSGRAATGTVSLDPIGVTCGDSCTQTMGTGSYVRLIADAGIGSAFAGWSGACSGTDDDCLVRVADVTAVTARFATARDVGVSVSVISAGGAIRVTPGDVVCTTTVPCTGAVRYRQPVTFVAVPDDGFAFDGWGGPCAGTATTCTLTMDRPMSSVTGAFQPIPDPSPVGPTPDPTPGPAPAPVEPGPIVIPVDGPNPPSPKAGTNPPGALALTGLRMTRSSFRARQGTELTFRLNQNAAVTMTFTLVGNPRVRYVYRTRAGSRGGDAGVNRVHISGRVRNRDVQTGLWRMTVRADNGTASSKTLRRSLRVVPATSS